VTGCKPGNRTGSKISLVTDTGVSKTLLNRNDWEKIKDNCNFVKRSKRFRPFGTAYRLPIRGKARVLLTAIKGAQIETCVCIVDDKREQSLQLGEADASSLESAHFLKAPKRPLTMKRLSTKSIILTYPNWHPQSYQATKPKQR